MPKQKEKRYEVAGKRLKIARIVMGKTQEKILDNDRWVKTVDIADAKTIGLWEREGVPENKLEKLADFLNITQFLLTDPKIEDVAFREIIELRKSDDNANIDHLFPSESIKDGSDRISDEDELEKAIAAYQQIIQKEPRFKWLERVFTPLEMIEAPELAQTTAFDLDEDRSDYRKSWEVEKFDQSIQKGSVLELMDQEPQLVLLGEPGTGKTTCLQWRCFIFTKEYKQGDKVVIYAPLAKYKPVMDLMDFVCHISNFRLEYLHHLLDKNRLILLLDSHNECPVHLQDTCLGQIISFLARWPNTPLILTSRIRYWKQELNLPVFTAQPLSRERQMRFLGTYLKDTELAENILDRLYAQPGGEIIAQNPWMLFMITEITQEGEDLPQGRAMMYRRYVQRWYEREFNKAYHSKTDLPWTKKQVFDDLCHIAAHMRAHGYAKEAPLSWLIDTLANKLTAGRKLLDFLGQGMICIVSQEDDSFGFEHETLQEYLSAEYVLKEPDLLKKTTGKISSNWDMVLAYAFELEKNPHEKFLKASWRLNPLLVALAIENTEISKYLDVPKCSPFIEDTIHTLRHESRLHLKDNDYEKLPSPTQEEANIIGKPEFQYIFQSNSIANKKLQTLKNDWGKRSIWVLYKFLKSGLLEKNEVPKGKKKKLIVSALRNRSSKYLRTMIKKDWIGKNDFSNKDRVFSSYLRHASPISAKILINAGFTCKDDFQNKMSDWISGASPNQAKFLLDNDLVNKEDLLVHWIDTVSPNQAKIIIDMGLAKRKDFNDKISDWIMNASIKQAKSLIDMWLATKDDFNDKISKWVKTATNKQSKQLIDMGLAAKDDFKDRIPYWIENASIKQAKSFIDMGLATKDDFNDRVSDWIEKASIKQVKQLIDMDLATKDDFKDKVSDWIDIISSTNAKQLIDMGLATKDDFKHRIRYWIRKETIKNAILLINQNLATKEDFKDKVPGWTKNATIKQAKSLIDTGLATKDDFEDKVSDWTKNATKKEAILLKEVGFRKPNILEQNGSFFSN